MYLFRPCSAVLGVMHARLLEYTSTVFCIVFSVGAPEEAEEAGEAAGGAVAWQEVTLSPTVMNDPDCK